MRYPSSWINVRSRRPMKQGFGSRVPITAELIRISITIGWGYHNYTLYPYVAASRLNRNNCSNSFERWIHVFSFTVLELSANRILHDFKQFHVNSRFHENVIDLLTTSPVIAPPSKRNIFTTNISWSMLDFSIF